MTVAVLFARSDSIYKTMPGTDVYDADRDARTWAGGSPGVYHPPCRAWGVLAHLAKPRQDERSLALFALEHIRKYGGVLEHPRKSRLWPEQGLPRPGEFDAHGGWTLPIFQSWFGHKAEKATFLYIVGCRPQDIPDMPMVLGETEYVICQNRTLPGGKRLRKGMPGWRPTVSPAEREHTPPDLAVWLVELARRCAKVAA
jgi:hypothetical protein